MSKREDSSLPTLIWNALLNFQRVVQVLCVLFIVVIISLAVVLRYGFSTDLYGIEEIVVVAAFWLYFIGGSYGSYEDSHIKADLVEVYVSNLRLRCGIRLVACLIETAVTAVLTWWAWGMITWGLEKGARSPGWGIPVVIPQGSILVGFALMTLYSIYHLHRNFMNFRSIPAMQQVVDSTSRSPKIRAEDKDGL